MRGISVEPVRAYFERLPSAGGKLLLNLAVSDHDGYDTIYLVPPELVAGYMGSLAHARKKKAKDRAVVVKNRFGIPFWLGLVNSPPILEHILVGIGMVTGVRD